MSSRRREPDEVQTTIEDGPTRYAAFAMRLRTIVTASSRYIAYSSDIGEAFRPLTNPILVRGAYGISWAYILGDCGYAGYLAHKERQDAGLAKKTTKDIVDKALTPAQKVELRKRQLDEEKSSPIKWNPLEASEPTHVGLVVARRAVFQSLASMALPAFTIHSIVRYSAPLFAKSANVRVRAAGPTIAGLAAVPALPFMFDHPIEHVVDTAFDWIELRLAEARAKAGQSQEKKNKAKDVSGVSNVFESVRRTEDGQASRTNIGATMASFAIVGVGVDMVHLPRLYTLMSRHASRLRANVAKSAAANVKNNERQGQNASGLRFMAMQQLAQRVMGEQEYSQWLKIQAQNVTNIGSKTFKDDVETVYGAKQVQKLATTWAVKEAAFKAISGVQHPRHLTWHDAYLDYIANTRKPTLCYTEQLLHDWQRTTNDGKTDAPPKLHVSITHDGDYVTAFVVAEQSHASASTT